MASCFEIKENNIHLRILSESLILFVFALAVRLAIFPYWRNLKLSGDELCYWPWARVVAGGALLKNFLHPPLWTYALSIPALISDNYMYGRFFTSIIASFSVPILYLLGMRVFNRKVGIIAGIAYSIYPNIVGFSHYLWPESLFSLLILLSSFFFFMALENETLMDFRFTKGDKDDQQEFPVKKTNFYLFLSFLISGISLLVKEFAIVHFGSMILTLFGIKTMGKREKIINATLIFLTPVIMYSAFASILARRPVILADAFVYNSNEADAGKKIWDKTTKENLRFFIGRLLKFRDVPLRFINQIYNLWAPNSFTIFRLLNSQEKYSNIPYARLIALITASLYIFVIILGLVGICCYGNNAFQLFAIANLLLLSSTGLYFLLCSRFRIPFIYIFILYSSAALSAPIEVFRKMTWQKILLLLIVLILFIEIIISKRTSFGLWG